MSRSSMAAVMRIGRRSVGRSKGRSALVVALILLPVAAMVAGITIVATLVPTPEIAARQTMGQADYVVYPGSGQPTTRDLEALLPPRSVVEPISFASDQLLLPGRREDVGLWSSDLDGLAAGRLELTAGRQPATRDEVAASVRVAEMARVGLGDPIALEQKGTKTVVGYIENPFQLDALIILEHVSVAQSLAADPTTAAGLWLVALPQQVDVEELPFDEGACIDACQFYATSRGEMAASSSREVSLAILVLGSLALFEALLVASAAFAVSIRRRQRELGLLAAAGGEGRHLAGTVLSEGAILGGVGVVLGSAIGICAVLGISPWLDELANRRVGPVNIDLPATLAAAALGLTACLIAAGLPARSAARLPVLAALSGRRPTLGRARRLFVFGVVAIATATALTAAGAALQVASPGATLGTLVLVLGGMLGVLGFGAWSPWLIEHLEHLGRRLPAAGRIALRDTARARSRSSPIVTAILAAFAATVAISSFLASGDASSHARQQRMIRQDQIVLSGEASASAGQEAARDLGAVGAGPIPDPVDVGGDPVSVVIEDPRRAESEREVTADVTIGDGGLLAALHAASAAVDLEAGSVIVLAAEPMQLELVDVVVWRDFDDPTPVRYTLPAKVVVNGMEPGILPGAVISPTTAATLNLAPASAWSYIIRLPQAVTEMDLGRAAERAARYSGGSVHALTSQSPYGLVRYILVAASLLFALIVTGIAVALADSEARPEQRTLLAVGADPRIRRRIAAMRAAVVALMAGVLAVPAGLLPAWGLLASRNEPLVVPVPEVFAAVVVLPLAGVLGALLLTRRIPSWSALRDVVS